VQLSQLHIRYCGCLLREISRRRCLRYNELPLNASEKASLLDENSLLGWRAISPYFLKKRRWVTQECSHLPSIRRSSASGSSPAGHYHRVISPGRSSLPKHERQRAKGANLGILCRALLLPSQLVELCTALAETGINAQDIRARSLKAATVVKGCVSVKPE
jgi:hypothetical protein